ncbi:exodeoxyribonuclease V subunit beta [Fodinibius salsisoli]|uniref:DNA 3'-5' helicase n=1 Tax=Fodinibius salsisoli TaxID=2820877 RepID=A0ABT3PQS0_9BACT|nr:exodeoxyribonuclease V subunit beta [Fodinibius salsisoli]MCW9708209.1 exodeoxyribonuclease V subunit beta [Fodinibius salsisoli]
MQPLKPFDISLSGINLVEASAGTGKTYNIASIYVRALIEGGLSVSEILVVTFTKAATKELKDRLLSRLHESIEALLSDKEQEDQFLKELCEHVEDVPLAVQRLEQARRTFDEAAIFTIHGFCQQVLQDQAFESRALYGMEMIGDDAELLLEVIDDYWRNWVAEMSDHPYKQPLLQLMIDRGTTPESLAATLQQLVGNPYLKVLPEESANANQNETLEKLTEAYSVLQEEWQSDRQKILEMLSREEMSNYRSDWLSGWMSKMDELLSSEIPSIKIFDQFDRFTQSRINNSLKKKAEKKGVQPPQHRFFQVADQYQRLAVLLADYPTSFLLRLIDYVQDKLPQKKEELEVLSYNDLLVQLEKALCEGDRGNRLAQHLRQSYPIAMVDEFQDTDPSQYRIFQKIYSGPEDDSSALFMIGDPKQSIYSFRGADVFSYLEAKKDAVKEKTYNLGRNFRSVPGLIEGINVFFGEHEDPFVIDQIHFEPVRAGKEADEYDQLTEYGKQQAPIQFRKWGSDDKQQWSKSEAAERAAKQTADEIYRLLEGAKKKEVCIGEDPLEAKDIAVLVRSHNQGDIIKQALRQRDIKSVQYSQQSVFKSEEADHLSILLKAVVEPSNESAVMAALATPLMGCQASELLQIEEDEQQWLDLLDRFSHWHRQWNEEGFAAMFGSIMKTAGIATNVMRYANGERRLTNLLHLGELLQQEDQRLEGGGRGLLKWLARKRQEEQGDQDEEQLRLESDEGLVKIVTMHRSKGLEYPVVFCPFLWYGPRIADSGQPLTFHENGQAYMDLQGKNDSERSRKRWLSRREELAESMRLAYVAITRAEHRCYLGWCYAKKSEFSPLGYLLYGGKASTDSLQQTISEKYEPLGPQAAEQTIQKLCESYPSLFSDEIKQGETDQQLSFGEVLDEPRLKTRRFNRKGTLKPSYRISSFSALTSVMDDHDPDIPDYDQFLSIYEGVNADEEEHGQESTMFSFPKGPQPGTCIHKIFEDIDFQDLDASDEIIRQNLLTYGIDVEWMPIVKKMLATSVGKPLLNEQEGIKLAAIPEHAQVQELEFYYQTGHIETSELLEIIRPDQEVGWQQGQAAAGFLKGFIDLTFQYKGKYYILDYKTNYLGDAYEDYKESALEEEMKEASYDLQYHIYTIALHRFLKQKLSDYDYETHLGGAFYLFLRGMNEEGTEGIFFDRPDEELIEALDQYILAGGEHE